MAIRNMHKPDLHFLCFLLSQQKSWETTKNVKNDLKQPSIRFTPRQSVSPRSLRPETNATSLWHWTNSRPEILYPFPCEGPNRHAKPQENALAYHLLIFVTCNLLQVCHFNWFGRLEDFPINQCGSLRHLARLVPAKMLRSGQIVKAALGFFALKSQRMLTVRAWFWCFEIWGIWKDKRILILQSLNHMTHACWSCNKPTKDKNSLFCWGWPIWLLILWQKRNGAISSLRCFQADLTAKQEVMKCDLWSGLCWHV